LFLFCYVYDPDYTIFFHLNGRQKKLGEYSMNHK
jgi:hypothetical protein